MRQTASKRLSRAVRSIAEWCRNNRHRPVCEQHAILSQKVRGHYAYYGITGNCASVDGVFCWQFIAPGGSGLIAATAFAR